MRSFRPFLKCLVACREAEFRLSLEAGGRVSSVYGVSAKKWSTRNTLAKNTGRARGAWRTRKTTGREYSTGLINT